MHKSFLKFYVSLLIALAPTAALSTDGMSRRSFLRGALAAAGTAAAAPSLLANTRIPYAIKLRLMKLRLSTLDNVDSGLENYINELKKIMEQTEPGRLKDFLNMRIEKAEKSLSIFKEVQLNTKGETITDHSSSSNPAPSSTEAEQHRVRQIHQENQKRLESLGDLESVPLAIRILMIRGLLDVDVLKRMAMQVHYGRENRILNSADLSLLIKYRELLIKTQQSVGESNLAFYLVPQFIDEVDHVLKQNADWQKIKGSAISCKKMI